MENTLWSMPTNTGREEEEDSMKSLFLRLVLQLAVLKVTETLTSGLRWTLFIGFWMLSLTEACGEMLRPSRRQDFICFSLICQCATTNLSCCCS